MMLTVPLASAGECALPDNFLVQISAVFNTHPNYHSTGHFYLAKRDQIFALAPIAYNCPDGVPPYKSFRPGDVLVVDRANAALHRRVGGVVEVMPSVSGKLAWHGKADTGSIALAIRQLLNAKPFEQTSPKQANIVARTTLTAALTGEFDSWELESGTEETHKQSERRSRYSVFLRGTTLKRFVKPQLREAALSAPGLPLSDVTYLSGGRHAHVVHEWCDELAATMPVEVMIQSPGRVTFRVRFSNYEAVSSEEESHSNLFELAAFVRNKIECSTVGKARVALSMYRDAVESYADAREYQVVEEKVYDLDCEALAEYDHDLAFAVNEAKNGLAMRGGRFDRAYKNVISEQLPALLHAKKGGVLIEYVPYWCDLFDKLDSRERAVDFLEDSRIIIISNGDNLLRKGLSFHATSKGNHSTASKEKKIWQELFANVVHPNTKTVSRLDILSHLAGAPKLDSAADSNSYLDEHYLRSAVSTDPPAESSQFERERSDSDLSDSTDVGKQNANPVKLDKISLMFDDGCSRAIALARKVFPKLSNNDRKYLEQCIERAFLTAKDQGKSTTVSRKEIDRLLSSAESTFPLWKLSNSTLVVNFGASTEWLFSSFLQKAVLSTQERTSREMQYSWQTQKAVEAKNRILKLYTSTPIDEYKPEKQFSIMMRDIERELTNPMNPLFRYPLSEKMWLPYRQLVDNAIEQEIRELVAAWKKVDEEMISFNSDDPIVTAKLRQGRKWIALRQCVSHLSAAIIHKYCMHNLPPLESPTFAPYKVKGIGVSYKLGQPVRVRLKPWLDNK